MFARFGLVMLCLIPVANASVIINEIMYNPPTALGDDSDFEWIELYNYGETIDLSGWTLDAGGKTTILSGIMEQDSYLVIARELEDGSDGDTDCFLCYYGSMPALDAPAWSLSNTAGTITLCNPDWSYCDIVSYSDSWGGDGDGSSLEFSGSDWLPSKDTDAAYQAGSSDGTPGHRNSVAPQVPSAIPEFSSLSALFVLIGSGLLIGFKHVN